MNEDIPKSVLIVDDDQEFLSYVGTALKSEGYNVVSAGSASEASLRLKSRRFILVLADLRLPGASGLEVLEEARGIDPLAVGIVLTTYSSVASAMEALREGAYDYLIKPCSPAALLAAVRRGMEHYHLKTALLHKTAQLEKLQVQLHDKSRMIQNVSHELKNPLSVVYGYAAFLLKDHQHFAPEELKKTLQSIHTNAERLGDLLEELLEATRLSSRKIELQREALSAAHLCREAVDNILPEARKRGIEVRLHVLPQDRPVNADPKRVHQILSNLLSNALKFTPQGGTVAISAENGEGFVRFCVRDTGVGIAAEDMPHLFERFYQAESTRRDHKGMGLGLEICKGLVELHGGRVWAESACGRGSSFYFTLPVWIALIDKETAKQ